jgi:plastocyanin
VVTISASAYSPTPLTVAMGTTVTWKNEDSMPHTATADNSSAFQFDTGNIASGATSGGITFTQAGTFEYICTYHPTMRGKITVQ